MEIKILVAYASTHGSTQEVAEVVAETLRGQGLVVDLQPARNVRSLEGYSAVVLGASLYMFHLHKDALRFLNTASESARRRAAGRHFRGRTHWGRVMRTSGRRCAGSLNRSWRSSPG